MKILTTASFSTIVGYVLREGDYPAPDDQYSHHPHLAVAGFDVFLTPKGGRHNNDYDAEHSGFNEIVIRDERGDGPRVVRCINGELRYDRSQREAMEYYFAVLISHISQEA